MRPDFQPPAADVAHSRHATSALPDPPLNGAVDACQLLSHPTICWVHWRSTDSTHRDEYRTGRNEHLTECIMAKSVNGLPFLE